MNKKHKPKYDDSELDDLFDVPKHSPTARTGWEKKRDYMLSHGVSINTMVHSLNITIAEARKLLYDYSKEFNHSTISRRYGKSMQQTLNLDMSKLEEYAVASFAEFNRAKHDYVESLGLYNEILLDKKPKLSSLFETTIANRINKEKPMNLTISHPVLIGNTNILTAKTFELEAIIRAAQARIEANKDLQNCLSIIKR